MRIISGKYRGLQLVSFEAGHLRPTTDRVKESQFNILRDDVEGAKILDLFAGTGNLGLEAISRGASEVTFVDKNKKSIAIIEKNIAKLKMDEPYKILQLDVLKYLKAYEGNGFDVIFVDPPFTEELAHDVMSLVAESRVFAPHTILTIESSRREKIEDRYHNLERYDVREFGDKFLSFFRKVP